MIRQPVKSSNIASVGYDADARLLHVEFLSTGVVYEYSGVEPEVYQMLAHALSVGKTFHARVKGKYPERELTADEAAQGRVALPAPVRVAGENVPVVIDLTELCPRCGQPHRLDADSIAFYCLAVKRVQYALGRPEAIEYISAEEQMRLMQTVVMTVINSASVESGS